MTREPIVYDDFVVHIGPDDGPGHRVYARALAGEAEGFLVLDEELRQYTTSAEAWRPTPQGRDPRRDKALRNALYALGQKLYDALFQQAIRELFIKSRARADQHEHGLRLCLELSPQHPELLPLFSLPWELLRPPDESFLILRREASLIRYPTVPRPRGERPAIQTLRVLVVLAEPEDQRPLEGERELQALEAVWRNHPTVHVQPLRNPSLDQTMEYLDANEVHVLHFIGHGGYDPDQDQWVLCFAAPEGKTHYVPAAQLAEDLRDARHSLRLVVLNACLTARVLERGHISPSAGAGVAMAMVLTGLTGVVATQAIISDRAAIELTRGLYHRLAAGESIESAMAEGRKRIRRKEWTGAVWPAEWAVPVLFLRGSGELFEVAPEHAREEEPADWRPSPLGLAAMVSGGLGLAMLAALAALWVGETPAAQKATAVFAAALGGLGWFGRRLWALYESRDLARDLSHAILARVWLVVILFALPLLALAGWQTIGEARLYDLTCFPLKHANKEEWRIAALPFKGSPGLNEKLWAEETRRRLARLTLKEARFYPVEPEMIHPTCFDAVLEGAVVHGQEVEHTLLLSEPFDKEVPRTGTIDDRNDIEPLRIDVIRGLLDAMGVELDAAEVQQIGKLPSKVPEAIQLVRSGVRSLLGKDLYKAQLKFRGALILDPEYADAHGGIAFTLLYGQVPDFEGAIHHYEVALERLPMDPEYLFNLGLALEKRASASLDRDSKEYAQALREAAESYHKALEGKPFWAKALNNLGFVHLLLGELDEAERFLNKGHPLGATIPELLPVLEKNQGLLAYKKKNLETALEYFERSSRSRYSPPESLYYLSLTQHELGDEEAACASLARYAESAQRDEDDERRKDAADRLSRKPCSDRFQRR